MGGENMWLEQERASMEREYRMRSIEVIVGNDGVCDEEIPGILAMSDKLVNYVITGDHNLPASADKEVPPLTLKDLDEPGKTLADLSRGYRTLGDLSIGKKVPEGDSVGAHEPGPQCGPECGQP